MWRIGLKVVRVASGRSRCVVARLGGRLGGEEISVAEESDLQSDPMSLAFDRADRQRPQSGLHPSCWDSDTLVSVFIELSKIKEEANAWLKKVGSAMEVVEESVVKYFQQEGKQRDTRRGRTAYLTRELWPKIEDEDLLERAGVEAGKDELAAIREAARARLIEALLSDPSTSHLVSSTYNGQVLRSYVLHDLDEDPETFEKVVPPHLQGVLGVVEKFRVKVLKS